MDDPEYEIYLSANQKVTMVYEAGGNNDIMKVNGGGTTLPLNSRVVVYIARR